MAALMMGRKLHEVHPGISSGLSFLLWALLLEKLIKEYIR